MACYSPVQAWLTTEVAKNGRRVVVFELPKQQDRVYLPIKVPCGQCIGCRLDRAKSWAIRCVHESKLHDDNCFITLTYDIDKVSKEYDGSLKKRDVQLFIKRLRKRFPDVRFRYLLCGEYGERYSRPHYHVCLFGFSFPDRKIWKKSSKVTSYTSDILNEVWSYGYCLVGDFTFATAAYVAGYVIKKQFGKDSDLKYLDFNTGLLREKEFILMSRRPGLGKGWIQKFSGDVYPSDQVVIDGFPRRPCRYYDSYISTIDEDILLDVKKKRIDKIKNFKEHCTNERLAVREKIAHAKLKTFKKRSYENG